MAKKKIIRAVTSPLSLTFLRGIMRELSDKYEMVALSSSGKEQQGLAASDGVRCITVEMERHISLLNDLRALVQLVGVMLRERPCMVHSMTPKAGLLCMMAAWLTRVPVRVHTFTGLVFPTTTGLKRRILMLTDSLTCACATHVVPEGEGVRHDLRQYGITRKPMRVLGYGNVRGIDLTHFDPAAEEVRRGRERIEREVFAGERKFTFVFVGRVVSSKGVNELVKAFRRLCDERRKSRLVLVGAFEDTLDPVSASTRREMDGNADILAVGAQSDVRPWYAAADVCVLPSYREGVPNVVLEAGAMALPSIVTDINGSREIISNGENGLIVPPRSVDALHEAMCAMMDDDEARRRMAAAARPRIAARYEQGFVRKCLYDFYDEILSL